MTNCFLTSKIDLPKVPALSALNSDLRFHLSFFCEFNPNYARRGGTDNAAINLCHATFCNIC